jgi:uncharacterized BrkB/YihY/UPF0761 family membrane protein
MKRLYLILSIWSFFQMSLVTFWYAYFQDTDTEQVKNFKFVSWVVSLVLGILFLVLYNRAKNRQRPTHTQ